MKCINFRLSLFIILFFAGIRLVFAQSAPTINVHPDVYYSFDEVLYFEGRAQPNSSVQIQFQKGGAKPVKINVRSDNNGEWVLAEKIPLEEGDWEVRARIMKDGDAVSGWSNPRIFKVIATGVTIGGVNIKFTFLSLLLVILLVAGIFTIWYFLWKVKKLKSRLVTKEIREAKQSIGEGFAELRRDLLDELKLLEPSHKRLSLEEFTRKEHILRELDLLEKNMEKEISDIEEKIN